MKAVTYNRYGPPDVLELRDVETPTPKENEVLVRIRAAAVTTAEMALRKGEPIFARLVTGLRAPKESIPGSELAGEVVSVGPAVSAYRAGDEVVAATGASLGACAEYICIAEDGAITRKPGGATFEEAVAVCEGGLTALPFLRDLGHIEAGQRVLVNGASGAVGAAAVQLARHFGAEVTGVCGTTHVELVRSLGADHVIDYTIEDFTENGVRYDIVFDVAGKSSYRRARSSVRRGGAYLTTVISPAILFQMAATTRFTSTRAAITFTGLRKPAAKAQDLEFLWGLVRDGRFRPVVDRSYPLDDVVEAHRYVESGSKHGSVLVTM
jgi:NADPH:quinone reductase-like Zn-dependent oxidoreductase